MFVEMKASPPLLLRNFFGRFGIPEPLGSDRLGRPIGSGVYATDYTCVIA